LDGGAPQLDVNLRSHPLLFEMIRSFITLAEQLNLSHAVRDLGSTRQTVRRHVSQLEEAIGGSLFDVRDRRYELTDLGRLMLPQALDLQARANAWISGQLTERDGFPCISARVGDWDFYQQQHAIGSIWRDEDLLLAETFRAWSMAGGRIEHQHFDHVRQFTIIYRLTDAGWICVEFGRRSFYVGWFGEDYAKSSIGRPLGKLPGGEGFARMLDEAFHEVQQSQSARFDHVFTQVPWGQEAKLMPVAYKRLMLCGRFPDESLAVISLVLPTRHIQVAELDSQRLADVRELVTVEYEQEEMLLSHC
jgi:hypothetical protein